MADDAWTVQNAKAQLSELMRRARDGEPQRIGASDPCVLVSEKEWTAREPRHLGRWLVETAPRGAPLDIPPRSGSHRPDDPFEDHHE